MASVSAINSYLQRRLVKERLAEVDAVTGGRWLDEAKLLTDSSARPGLPLRELLRAGLIEGQWQEANRRWHISRVDLGKPATSQRLDALRGAPAPAKFRGPTSSVSSGNAEELMASVGLDLVGSVRWGSPIGAARPGVYIVEWDEREKHAPIDSVAVAAWIERVPNLRLDGMQPSADTLGARLAEFWIPDETIVYVGLTSTAIAKRIRQYERTPLGDARPHSGGHWLKTLADYERHAMVSWAYTDDFAVMEASLIGAFASMSHDRGKFEQPRQGPLMPFANLQLPNGARKLHGISGSRLR